MVSYKVKIEALSGRFGKTYREGDIVTDKHFQPGIHKSLAAKGFIVKLSESDESVEIKKTIKKQVSPQRVDAGNVEFGYELISALPYAYFLHQNGLLIETISAVDTEPLYWFSPRHRINESKRTWDNMKNARSIPNIAIHRPSLDFDVWSPPPLKEKYRNNKFVFDKPTLCICNRVNSEWGRGAINYFDTDILQRMFMSLRDKYHIVYFNIEGRPEFYDGVTPISINDTELCRQYGITTIHDLHRKNPNLSFNTVQLMVMANCERFITMNGGYSILASYMGGVNLIYTRESRELLPNVNSYYRWYHRFGGSRIEHANNYEDFENLIDTHFIRQLPTLNILIRTFNRPNYFRRCMESISRQDYPNIRVIVGCQNKQTDEYLIPYRVTPVYYDQYDEIIPSHTNKHEYGNSFPSNYYMNHLRDSVTDGFVLMMDDDDGFTEETSASQIMNAVENENSLVMWRIFAMNKIIPSDDRWMSEPYPRDISGISYCMHSKHFKTHTFEPYRLADYRLARDMWRRLKPVYIDKLLTEMQSGNCNMGRGNDADG